MADLEVKIPQMCQRHQARLVKNAKFAPTDAWRALVIVAQIALFQAAAATPSIQKKLGGKIEKLSELGCLACRLPGRFDTLINVAKSRDVGAIKRLGESWLAAAMKKEKDDGDSPST